MPTKAAALQAFMEGFGVPAYAANSVPDRAEPPYITYTLVEGAWGDGEVAVQADLWMRTDSEAEPNAKVDEISRAIGMGGAMVACDGGGMWVKRGQPWAQAVADADNAVKRRYMNLSIEYITAY